MNIDPADVCVMVLAAGLGTRLMPLTGDISKPMVPIVNRPVMEHTMRRLARTGFKKLMVNLHYLPDAITEHFGDGSKWGLEIEYSFEEKLLGTAGGVKRCEDFLKEGGTFLVVSGDALTDVDLLEMLRFHKESGALATIMATPVEDVSHYGIVMSDGLGRVTGFQEKPAEAEAQSTVANSGIYAFEPEVFDMIPAGRPYDFGRELFPGMVESRAPLFAWSHRYYWNDVGSIEEYQRGNFDALEGKVHVEVPGVEIAPRVWIGQDTQIKRDVLLTPPVCIGDHCVIESGARLLGPVIVGPDTTVMEGAVLFRGIKWGGGYIGRDASMVGSIAGSESMIGDGAAVLDGAVIGSGTIVKDGIVIDPSVKIMPGTVVDHDKGR